jgi:hypothetical protein
MTTGSNLQLSLGYRPGAGTPFFGWPDLHWKKRVQSVLPPGAK